MAAIDTRTWLVILQLNTPESKTLKIIVMLIKFTYNFYGLDRR